MGEGGRESKRGKERDRERYSVMRVEGRYGRTGKGVGLGCMM